MKPFTLWTRGITPRLNCEVVPHITYDVDLYDSNRFVLAMGTETQSFTLRPYGWQVFATYVANGR